MWIFGSPLWPICWQKSTAFILTWTLEQGCAGVPACPVFCCDFHSLQPEDVDKILGQVKPTSYVLNLCPFLANKGTRRRPVRLRGLYCERLLHRREDLKSCGIKAKTAFGAKSLRVRWPNNFRGFWKKLIIETHFTLASDLAMGWIENCLGWCPYEKCNPIVLLAAFDITAHGILLDQ